MLFFKTLWGYAVLHSFGAFILELQFQWEKMVLLLMADLLDFQEFYRLFILG